jgi:hypothetical protein
MRSAARLTCGDLTRSSLLVSGVLLACLGVGNWIAGYVKLGEYGRLAAEGPVAASEGVELSGGFTFTVASESEERRNVAVAKLHYYNVVVTAGQLLFSIGLLLSVAGYVRARATFRLAGDENKTTLDRLGPAA